MIWQTALNVMPILKNFSHVHLSQRFLYLVLPQTWFLPSPPSSALSFLAGSADRAKTERTVSRSQCSTADAHWAYWASLPRSILSTRCCSGTSGTAVYYYAFHLTFVLYFVRSWRLYHCDFYFTSLLLFCFLRKYLFLPWDREVSSRLHRSLKWTCGDTC